MATDYFLVRKGATALPNAVIHSALSFPALGILTYALSLPEHAPKGYRVFMQRGMGKTAILGALKELEAHNLRFRFRARRAGQFRDIIVFADTPTEPGEVYEEILAQIAAGIRGDLDLISCESHPDLTVRSSDQPGPGMEQNRRSDRGAEFSARLEQVAQDTSKEGVGVVDEADRGVENRARLSAPHISKDISNSSSLRSDENIHPSSAENVLGDHAQVGGVDDGISDWQVLRAAMPRPLVDWIYTGRSAQTCTGVITELKRRGWSSRQIYDRLNRMPLPENIANPTGLAIFRVKSLLGEPTPTPTRVKEISPDQAPAQASTPEQIRDQISEWQQHLTSGNEILERVAQANIARLTERLTAMLGIEPASDTKDASMDTLGESLTEVPVANASKTSARGASAVETSRAREASLGRGDNPFREAPREGHELERVERGIPPGEKEETVTVTSERRGLWRR